MPRMRASSRMRGKYAQESSVTYQQTGGEHQNSHTAWCERFTINGTVLLPQWHRQSRMGEARRFKICDEMKVDQDQWVWLKIRWSLGCRFTSRKKTRRNLCGAKLSGATMNLKRRKRAATMAPIKASLSRLPDDL